MNIIYLVHRFPYPPNKGDKVRSYHLLRYLLTRGRVFLATFVDSVEDLKHVDVLRAICPDLYVEFLSGYGAKLRSLASLGSSRPLTLAYYQSHGMRDWVRSVVAQHHLDVGVVFSSAMGPYSELLPFSVPIVVDFVDVDSYKWLQYAEMRRQPWAWLYRREARALLSYERTLSQKAHHSFFITEKERDLFLRCAPECGAKVGVMSNGVDANFFAPIIDRNNPFPRGQLSLVFTGAMDYLPNVDAVVWFVADVLPQLLLRWPQLHFYIVGRNPAAEVQSLRNASVTVTGAVDDVRPFLQYAAAVVAPLRVARGIQNKILEAMAMARSVVTVTGCADAIGADVTQGIVRADTAEEYEAALAQLLDFPGRADVLGVAAREYVVSHYDWGVHMKAMDPFLPQAALQAG